MRAIIISGEGILGLENQIVPLYPGDCVIIDRSEWYCWEGHFKMTMICTPPWSVNQYEQIES